MPKKIVEKHKLLNKTNVFFNPVGGKNAKQIVAWILQDKLDARVGLQLHKIIWNSMQRGV